MAKSTSQLLRGAYVRSERRIEVSVGESVRTIRGLQGLSQHDLAKVTRIPRTSISAIENNRMRLVSERAKVLARALKCHPAVLVPPDQEVTESGAIRAGVALAQKRRGQTLAALKQVDERRLVSHREVEAWVRGLRAARKPGSGGRRSS